ncbi:PucR family transcriptional regulator ligand-binding domain-containing protein [Rhodococcus sp. GXMU-t2271]|uniref:PucR family transcriptional regulator ligand-binding domain-containing protein n=1 Tax=Rhodococcus indonesiensis TaxID=3055869 RepID=A0ABT7RQ14_9NOCA|nr:PucR family transcriptional regulator [Rhodococcus indonesiensis]MDM7489742.1 PucR family transcriptional regulator ligand-binding domain-containing protein [Rhodococcus indonesiensis]
MISVDQLVAVPSLGLKYLAGAHGGGRLVTWAHACDLPDPWLWFEAGDLVMTTGAGLPEDEREQARWMEQLIDSQVSALVVAPRPDAPDITPALLEVAERRGFPVLSAGFDLQFVCLARTVIESAVESERQRLATITRLYDVYWQALHARGTFADRISTLEGTTGWALQVRDQATGEVLVSGRLARHRQATSLTAEGEAVEIPIPGTREIVLSAAAGKSPVNDRPLLQHLGGLIALELEHEAAQKDRLRASGADLLLGLLDETVTVAAVWPELRHRGMTGAVVVACWSTPDASPLRHESIHRDVSLQQYAPLLVARPAMLIGIVPCDLDLLAAIGTKLAQRCAVGISDKLSANSSVVEAARQAQLAVARAHEQHRTVQVYGEDTDDGGFLPRSVEETRRFVRATLGPLLAHDKHNDSDLVNSVRVFLRHDGAWQRSADELSIHRQTLVYRLRRVEQLTGLKPTSTEGSAMLWLALTAAERASLDLDELID